MMRVTELETPFLVLNRAKMLANISRMRSHLDACGVTLRPHLKTSKCSEIAELLTQGQRGGITVSTLGEADFFASKGFRDILYPISLTQTKVEHVARLLRDGINIKVVVDSLDVAHAVSARARQVGVELPVLVEVDCDDHRLGVKVTSDDFLALANALHNGANTKLCGVMSHAGSAYDCTSTTDIRLAAENERAVATGAATKLRQAGFPCPIVSIGSTPTVALGERFDGVTEVRAGVFVFNDLMMANLGICKVPEIALSVACTVIGHRVDRGWLITDSGWSSLSSDQGTFGQHTDFRFGQVCDGQTGDPIADLSVVAVNQEHGVIAHRDGRVLDVSAYPIGTMFRILPIHACATAEAHNAYHVIDEVGNVTAVWKRIKGWASVI